MPYFAANISEGHLFNPKSITDRIAAGLDAGFEAIEISQPYRYSAPALAATLGDDNMPENIDVACIDSYAPSTQSDIVPDEKLSPASQSYPRGHMGYAAVPGEIASFCSSLERTLLYASALDCKTINLLMGIPHHNFDAIVQSVKILGLSKGEEGAPDAVRVEFVLPLYESSGVSEHLIQTLIPLPFSPLSHASVDCPHHLADPRPTLADTKAMTLARRLLPAPMLAGSALSQAFCPAYLPEVAVVCAEALRRHNLTAGSDTESACVTADTISTASTTSSPLGSCPQSPVDAARTPAPALPSVSPFAAHSYPHLFSKALPPALAHAFPDLLLQSLAFTTMVTNVAHAASLVRARIGADCYICLEPVSDVPGYALTSLHQLLRTLVHVGADNVGILFDCYHVARLHGAVTENLSGLLPLIRHVQIAGVPLREEPVLGELNGVHVLRHLDQLRYQGWVGLEYRPAPNHTRQGLEPWFSQLQCRRHGSAGILFTCVGKQGKPYVLLGQDHKKGNPWGPFWGRPDKDDRDVQWTAVRETMEESLGVIGDSTLLYSALKNEGFHYKLPTANLFLVHLGVMGAADRQAVVKRYTTERDQAHKGSSLTKCESEVLAVQWVDLAELHKTLRKNDGSKKGDSIKLRGFFRRELMRALECDPVMLAFAEKRGIALRQLSELATAAAQGESAHRWNSAPV